MLIIPTSKGPLTGEQVKKITFLYVPPVKWQDIIEARFYTDPAIARLYFLTDGTVVPVCTCHKFLNFPFRKKEIVALRRKPGAQCQHSLALLLFHTHRHLSSEAIPEEDREENDSRGYRYQYVHLQSLSPREIVTEADILKSANSDNLKEFIQMRTLELEKSGKLENLEYCTMLPNTKKIKSYVERQLEIIEADPKTASFAERGTPIQLFFVLETRRFYYCARRYEFIPQAGKDFYFKLYLNGSHLTTWKLGSRGIFSALENIKSTLFMHGTRGEPLKLEIEFYVPDMELNEKEKFLLTEIMRTLFPHMVVSGEGPQRTTDQTGPNMFELPCWLNFEVVKDIRIAVADFIHFVSTMQRFLYSLLTDESFRANLEKTLLKLKKGIGNLLQMKQKDRKGLLSLIVVLQELIPGNPLMGSQFNLKCRKYTSTDVWPYHHHLAKRLLLFEETNSPFDFKRKTSPNIIIDI